MGFSVPRDLLYCIMSCVNSASSLERGWSFFRPCHDISHVLRDHCLECRPLESSWIAKYLTRRPRAINCIYNLIRQRHECQLRKIVKEDFVCLFPEMNSRRTQAHIILHIYISRSLPSALFLNRCYCTLVDLILPILSLPPRSRWHHQNRPSRPPTPSTRIQTAARGRTTFKSIWPIVLILY